jgi:peptidoglycan/LPS O-acetylase OafA/YrhL
MTGKFWLSLTPSLFLAIGIVLASLVAVRTAGSGWFLLAGPLVLSLAIVSADMLASRLSGKSAAPSPAALILAAAFLLAGFITFRDPAVVKTIIPIMGAAGWAALLVRPPARATPATKI